jgi:hypothetical protein
MASFPPSRVRAFGVALLLVAAGLSGTPARATSILYDSIGEDNFAAGNVPTFNYYRNVLSEALAMPFRPVAQGEATEVVFAGFRLTDEFVDTRVELWFGDPESAGLPGYLLAATDCLCRYGDGVLNTVAIAPGTVLDPANRYWVAIRRLQVTEEPNLGWSMNTLGIQSQVGFQTVSGIWLYDTAGGARKTQAAFRVVGNTVIPVPAALPLLLSALVAIAGLRRVPSA